METLLGVITDKGSKYAVSGGVATSREAALGFVKTLKKTKKFAKATHNSWAVVLADGTLIKNDDGESGAGRVIAQHLEGAEARDLIIVVTRWYGGVKLGGDRFRHVGRCVAVFLAHWAKACRDH